jgi:hypothetical protein
MSRSSHTSRGPRSIRGRLGVLAATLILAASLTSSSPILGTLPGASAATSAVATLAGGGAMDTLDCWACMAAALGGTIFNPPEPILDPQDGTGFVACIAACAVLAQ